MEARVLKCPNCGALMSTHTTRCEYCGAYIYFQNDTFALHNLIKCHTCGASVGEGSLLCVGCGTILATSPTDIESLKEIQKRITFIQKNLKEKLPSLMREKLNEDEYIYFIELAKYVDTIVTDRRIMRFTRESKGNPVDKLEDIPYSEVVSVGNVETVPLPPFSEMGWKFVDLVTFSGSLKFVIVSNGAEFQRAVQVALDNHVHKRKDINAIIHSVRFPA